MSDVSTVNRKSWLELRKLTEFYRKISSTLNSDVPSNISFYPIIDEYGQKEYRLYYLSGTSRRETTIKYINIKSNQKVDILNENLLFNWMSFSTNEKVKLTKEEQLLRERQRCSFNGITSYVLDENTGRLVFSERSELFYHDSNQKTDAPLEVETSNKGAIDYKICPYDSNLVSYIIEGNLWVKNLNTDVEVKLTSSEEHMTNGVPSFIVQEEFDRYSGYWWQPKKKDDENFNIHRIVYEVVDENCVDLIYITPSCNDEFGYDSYRYPRAGTTNARTYLKMVEFSFEDEEPTVKQKSMRHSFYELFDWYEYFVRGGWVSNGKYFWVQILDRLQMHLAFVLIPSEFFKLDSFNDDIDMQTNDDKVLVLIEQHSDVWINIHEVMHIFDNKKDDSKLTLITANAESKFLHLQHYIFNLDIQYFSCESPGVYKSTSNTKTKLTDGDWCIEYKHNVFVDEENNLVYFMAYKNPLENQLFVVNISEPFKIKQVTPAGFSHMISMSSDCSLFVTICSNLNTPNKAYVYQIINQKLGIDKLSASQIAQIYSSRDELRPNLDSDENTSVKINDFEKTLKPPQIFKFQTSDGCTIYGMIYLPANYTPNVKYPTVLYVYGGPHVQLVSNSYKANRFMRLHTLSLLGYCVVVIDSRGSDYRGLEFEAHIKHKMGTVEIQDQVEGLQYASNTFQCIDMNRIAIFGWSYGGYMALMGLAQRPDIFKLSISGAPVTCWELYDTGYTERYMGLPNINKEAYFNGSVLNWASKFPNDENRLLIIHGMIDENVHFAHTRRIIDALIMESKPYNLQVYPNERHGIRTPEASIHCDLSLFSFLERYL